MKWSFAEDFPNGRLKTSRGLIGASGRTLASLQLR